MGRILTRGDSVLYALLAKRKKYLDGRIIRYMDPLHLGRHPFQTFIMALALVSVATTILAGVEPSSIEATLPGWVVFGWFLMLGVGCSLSLAGAYWRGGYTLALTLERIGLDFTGIAGVIYGLCVVGFAGLGGLVAAAIVLAFGAACLVRARDIALIFHATGKYLDEKRTAKEGG